MMASLKLAGTLLCHLAWRGIGVQSHTRHSECCELTYIKM